MIIGIHGKAKSGKTTACTMLRLSLGFKEKNFADPLKAAAEILFKMSPEQVRDQDKKEVTDPRWGFTPRFAQQRLGTECMRTIFREDFWIYRLRLDLDEDPSSNFVIGDVRFPNEADAIKAWGGTVIKIHRDGAGLQGEAAKHPSEVALDNYAFDKVIDNNGTLQYFEALLKELVHDLS